MTGCWDRICHCLRIVICLQRGKGAGGEKVEDGWEEEFLKPQGEAKRAGLGLRSLLASDPGLPLLHCSQLASWLCPTLGAPTLGN